jgi:AAA+ superfamily predicted ATPase
VTAPTMELQTEDRGTSVLDGLRRCLVNRRGLALFGHVDDLIPTTSGPALRLPQVLALSGVEAGVTLVTVNPMAAPEFVVPPGARRPSIELPAFSDDPEGMLSETLGALGRCSERYVVLLTHTPCSAEHGDRVLRTLLRTLPVSHVMPANVTLVVAFSSPEAPDFLVHATGWEVLRLPLPDLWERRRALSDWLERGIFTPADLDPDQIAGATAGLELDDLRRLVAEHEQLRPLTAARIAAARQLVLETRLDGLLRVDHRPSVTFDDVAGGEALKDLVRHCDFTPIALNGPPGTGKTLLALATARELGLALLHLDSSLKGSFVGHTARNIALVREVVTAYAPVVVFIDEVDLLLGSTSDYNGDNGTSNEIRKFVLELLNDAKDLNVQVIVASNNPWSRVQSRVRDRIVSVPVLHPTGENVLVIARLEAEKAGVALSREAEQVLADAQGVTWTGRQIKKVISGASSQARRAQVSLLTGERLAPLVRGLPGRNDRAAELNALEAVLVADHVMLPWVARADAGKPAVPLPPYLEGLVDEDGVLDEQGVLAQLHAEGLRDAR